MKKYLIFIALMISFFACQQDEPEADPVAVGFNFFPLAVGDFQVYEVEEVTHSSQGAVTGNFQRRVEVVDSFQNQTGTVTYVLHEFRRETDAQEWEFVATNSARRTPFQGILNEGNVPVLKLSFPISAGKMWDSNALNGFESDLFEMDSLFVPYITARGMLIPETLTVIQENNQDFTVNLERDHEIYGLNIGLVYSENIDLSFCIEEACLGQQIIEEGREVRQTLIEHGTVP